MAIKVCPNCFVAEQSCNCTIAELTEQSCVYGETKHPCTYKEEYEKLRSICLRIYYARIAMQQADVIKGLDKLEAYFREPNMN